VVYAPKTVGGQAGKVRALSQLPRLGYLLPLEL